MKCHYTYDQLAGKVLIPGCIGVAAYQDMQYCTCRAEDWSWKRFESKIYQQQIKAKSEEIKGLEKENASLNRIIKNLLKNNPK